MIKLCFTTISLPQKHHCLYDAAYVTNSLQQKQQDTHSSYYVTNESQQTKLTVSLELAGIIIWYSVIDSSPESLISVINCMIQQWYRGSLLNRTIIHTDCRTMSVPLRCKYVARARKPGTVITTTIRSHIQTYIINFVPGSYLHKIDVLYVLLEQLAPHKNLKLYNFAQILGPTVGWAELFVQLWLYTFASDAGFLA